ncbi:TlpA disulfide reductase family protein [Dyadobacter sp. CY323]|uniref:TlpA family protein disulfide reductase n=1 Tax=Dyadobacter sp. CY323 TaxID=2907302 RepID=UPI001F3B6750|nr:TlpA disulfide reductase family protein [Dyadobacter sp. CY323]MCE6989357.1 TlpA family protein disulfide reductase [Dyadobacter sp. CY323]
MEADSTNLQKLGAIPTLLLLLICITSCETEKSQDIVIRGDLLSSNSVIEGKKLYVGDNNTRAFLDSVVVKNGKFQFRIRPNKDFIPFRCSIVYATGNPKWPYQLLGYKNPYIAKTQESIIYADRGIMHLRRDTTLKVAGRDLVSFIIENPNKQTQAAFRHLTFRKNPEALADKHKFNVALVKKYSYSVDLLNQLEWSKKDLGEKELAELVTLFEPALQKTTHFTKINRYLKYDNNTGDKFPTDLSLKKPDNTATSEVLGKNAEYNLVIFWASWCGPCLQEIPQLKKLHAKHKSRVTITSISTDKSNEAWKKTLKQEKMPWNQFIVDEESMAQLDKKYNLQSIPLSLLFDRDGNLLERKLGYDSGEESVDIIVELHLIGNK